MSFIKKPNGHSVHLNNVSKDQLARALNAQSETLKKTRQQLQDLGRALIAIVLAPDAVTLGSRSTTITKDALKLVQDGMELQFEFGPEKMTISVLEPREESRIITPKILGVN